MLRRSLAQNVRVFTRMQHSVRGQRRFYSVQNSDEQDQGNYGPKKGDRVVVAMSGGVDSSVSARLLADKDYNLSAIFMRNWDTRDESGTDKGCEWEKDWEDVQLVCRQLNIPCQLVDLSRKYWINVFEPSLRKWESGETPNPDVRCNREVKFGALMDHVLGLGGAWLATGHYAGIEWARGPSPFSTRTSKVQSDNVRCRPKLVRPVDRSKDQTYYLSSVKESSLKKAIFPLQHIPKSEVRELAKKYDLPTARREESMGLCFIGEKRRFEDFLAQYIPPKPGPIYDLANGKKLGTHKGLWRYTIGQNAKLSGQRAAMYVARKDVQNDALFVVPGSANPLLYSSGIVVRDFHWIWQNEIPPDINSRHGFEASVQFRHRSMYDVVSCTVRRLSSKTMAIEFAEPQLAIAPGQVAALYYEEDKWCLGSGEITKGIPINDYTAWLHET